MYEFEYHRAASVDDAVAARKADEDRVYLAGGHTLIPTLKQGLAMPSTVVDLGAIESLRGIAVGVAAQGKTVTVKAMTPHGQVAASAEVAAAIPALADLAGQIGDRQVRVRGTIGGSLANSDPAADYPAAVLGLGAQIETDRRSISADEYFLDLFETALEEGELITAVHFPVPDSAAYVKFPNPASRYAVVGVFVARFGTEVRVGVTGAGPCAFRMADMESALAQDFSVESIAGMQPATDRLNEDLHASAEYRAHLVTVMAQRAVAALS